MTMALNPLARFVAAYHGDLYTLKMALTRLALGEHHLPLHDVAQAWKPRNEFERGLQAIALRYVPLSVPRNMAGPTARVQKQLETAIGIATQETLNQQTLANTGRHRQ